MAFFGSTKTHLFTSPSRYLIDKLGEENEEEKKVYRDFLRHNAASVRKNAMCNPTATSNSNISNSCHIVYMDGSPSYPASGSDTKYEDSCTIVTCCSNPLDLTGKPWPGEIVFDLIKVLQALCLTLGGWVRIGSRDRSNKRLLLIFCLQLLRRG